jgi:signal transduction histidine kinase
MNREEIARRWRAFVAWLRRTSGQSPRLTLWGWAADATLAVALTIAAVNGAMAWGDSPKAPRFDAGFGVSDDNTLIPLFPPDRAPAPPVPPNPDLYFPHTTTWQFILVALTTLPLLTRRRFPLASFWIVAIAAPQVYAQLAGANTSWTVVASVVAAYSALTYSRYRSLAIASVVIAVVFVIARNSDDLPGLPSGVMTYLLLAAIGLAANAIHIWRQRAQTAQGEQEAATRLAVERERARLARELHDVVGHNVSMMVIQAGAARKVMDATPDLAREALLAVEAGGRAAMTELRQVINLLTVDTDGVDLAPQPGLHQVPDLAARVRETGVPVTLTMTGTFESLPTGVDLAAYRVVQETLTNAVKHAAGAAVTIDVTGTADELRVEVADSGGSTSTADPGGGRGLAGLRERLSAYGGTLTAGRRPTGGYRVVAAIPLRGQL